MFFIRYFKTTLSIVLDDRRLLSKIIENLIHTLNFKNVTCFQNTPNVGGHICDDTERQHPVPYKSKVWLVLTISSL